MDAQTLREAMGRDLPTDQHPTLVADFNDALVAAGCTTINRAAMFAAQVGHESLGLRSFGEIWGPTAAQKRYEGRQDLGNTVPGDGYRFRGRGPIQLTGRLNYGAFSRWCHARGLVAAPDHLVRNPDLVGTSSWGFLAAAWYWTAARPKINGYCDAGDLTAVTRAINGGTNGIDDRRTRWDRCRRLGARVLPSPPRPTGPDPAVARRRRQQALLLEDSVERVFDGPFTGARTGRIICPVGSASAVVAKAWLSASFDGGARIEAWFQDAVPGNDGPAPGKGNPIDWTLRNADRAWVEVPDGTEFIQYRVSNAEGSGAISVELAAK